MNKDYGNFVNVEPQIISLDGTDRFDGHQGIPVDDEERYHQEMEGKNHKKIKNEKIQLQKIPLK